jgi:hypothetical protein
LGSLSRPTGNRYLDERLTALDAKLRHVDTLAQSGQLVGVDIAEELLTITPHTKSITHAAEILEDEACRRTYAISRHSIQHGEAI